VKGLLWAHFCRPCIESTAGAGMQQPVYLKRRLFCGVNFPNDVARTIFWSSLPYNPHYLKYYQMKFVDKKTKLNT